jgi:hypothetical protein
MLGNAPARLAPEILAHYTGLYEYAPGRPARITSESDLLFLQEGANPLKLPFAAATETNFISRTNGDRLEFTRDANGAVSGFVYHTGAGDRRAVRKP